MITSSYSLNGKFLLFKKPLISLIKASELEKLPSDRLKYLKLYKYFFKLRYLIDKNPNMVICYQTILRRYFKHQDFNARRNAFLNASQILTKREIIERLTNTLAFVYNSTAAFTDKPREEVYYYEDLKEPERIETSVIRTILEMDIQKPNSIKYDFKYAWVKELDNTLASLPEDPSLKCYKSKVKEGIDLIGFRQYERSLIMLNESYKLCL